MLYRDGAADPGGVRINWVLMVYLSLCYLKHECIPRILVIWVDEMALLAVKEQGEGVIFRILLFDRWRNGIYTSRA